MTMRLPRLPIALDPLIAEAKRRMRRRRLVAVALVVCVGLAVGLTLESRSPRVAPSIGVATPPSPLVAGGIAALGADPVGGQTCLVTPQRTVECWGDNEW